MTPVEKRQRGYNLEFRAADNAGNPYLILTMIVRAGLQGILEKLPAPPCIRVDPDELDQSERERLGIERLPASLEEAMTHLVSDAVARSWLPEELYETFLTLKRGEIADCASLGADETCGRYARIY